MRRWQTALLSVSVILAYGVGPALGGEATQPAPAGKPVPYVAVVTVSDKLSVRSGPGMNYYRTGWVMANESVVVVREEPGRWLAIRPPKGSFSYIHAKYVKQRDDGKWEVAGKNVRVRVGSTESDKRDAWHWKVSGPDVVEVLDFVTKTVGTRTEEWARIQPIPGEVRWVSGQFVKFVRAMEGARDPGHVAPPTAGPDPTVLKAFNQANALYKAVRAKPIKDWDFAEAKRLFQSVVAKGTNVLLRGRAAQALRRIQADEELRARNEEFIQLQEDIAARMLEVDARGGTSVTPAPTPTTQPQPTPTTQPVTPGLFAAEGVLRENAFPLADDIVYNIAATADSLQVQFYLQTSQTGLAAMVKKRVRVEGVRLTRQEWGADLIQVRKITVVER